MASSVNGADQVPETSEGSHLEPAASEQTYPKPIDSTPTKRDALKRGNQNIDINLMESRDLLFFVSHRIPPCLAVG